MNRRIALAILSLSVLSAGDTAAQWNVARFGTEPNHVYTTVGLDPAMITTVGYGRMIPLWGHDFQFTGDVGVVAAHMDLNDFRARVGAQTSILEWRSMRLTGSATFITRGTENLIYTGLDFGADFTGTIGAYKKQWFAAGEFGFDKAIITHITNSDYYKKYYYADAKDGWYLDAGGTFHTGVVGGWAFGKAELVGRFGWLWTEDWNNLTPPMYASVGVGYGL